jgi:hypothetical protein
MTLSKQYAQSKPKASGSLPGDGKLLFCKSPPKTKNPRLVTVRFVTLQMLCYNHAANHSAMFSVGNAVIADTGD